MIVEKKDIYLGLIKDVHDICKENGITYFLHGKPAVSVYLDKNIAGTQKVVEVAMTQGDAERFQRIVEQKLEKGELKNRYIESSLNNAKFKGNYVMFGDLNTVEIDLSEWNATKSRHIIHNCIHLNIRFIDKEKTIIQNAKKKKKLISNRYMKKIHKVLNIDLCGWSLWYLRITAFVMNSLLRLIRGKDYQLKEYNDRKQLYYIDSWKDLGNYETVSIGKHKFDSSIFNSIVEIAVDNICVNIPGDFEQYATQIYGSEWKNVVEKKEGSFTNTYMSYDEFMNNKEIQNRIQSVRKKREAVFNTRKNAYFLRRKIHTVKKIVLMSKDKVDFTEQYLDEKEHIMSLSFEKDYEELKEIFQPLINSMLRLERRNIAYSVDSDIDNILFEILRKEGYGKQVKHIQRLQNKEYFT